MKILMKEENRYKTKMLPDVTIPKLAERAYEFGSDR